MSRDDNQKEMIKACENNLCKIFNPPMVISEYNTSDELKNLLFNLNETE
jgi:hypothetical protein